MSVAQADTFSRYRWTARLDRDFTRDLAEACEISYSQWRRRSVFERGPELVGWVLERQQ